MVVLETNTWNCLFKLHSQIFFKFLKTIIFPKLSDDIANTKPVIHQVSNLKQNFSFEKSL